MVASGPEEPTFVKPGLLVGGEDHGTLTTAGFRDTTLPEVGGRITKDVQKAPGMREEKWKANADITSLESKTT